MRKIKMEKKNCRGNKTAFKLDLSKQDRLLVH